MSELTALRELDVQTTRFRNTAIVDDDFPEVSHDFCRAHDQVIKQPIIPTIVCICGSTKFKKEWLDAQLKLTLAGEIVLSVGGFGHADFGDIPEKVFGEEKKKELDELHKRKIDLADYIYVINVDGYIGKSTKSEIEYAVRYNKRVDYLEIV